MITCLLTPPTEALLTDLHAFTNKLQPFPSGVLLAVSTEDAKRIAEIYHAPVGSAESTEHAHLLALLAQRGRVNSDTKSISKAALEVLAGLGVRPQTIERLTWLGLTSLGDVQRWSKTQLSAYLGDEAKLVTRYLKGRFTKTVAPYTPAPTLSERYAFSDPATEPWQLSPVLAHLSARLASSLGDRAAARLSLYVTAEGLTFSSSKLPKTILGDQAVLYRLAELALADSGAYGFGISTLTLQLAGLYRPAQQLSLWRQRENVAKAVTRVEARFPNALLKLTEVNPYIPLAEFAYTFTPIREGVTHETLSFKPAYSADPAGQTRGGERCARLVHH